LSRTHARSTPSALIGNSSMVPTGSSAQRPRKVLFVFGSLERAGAQLRSLEVCRELRRREAIEFDFCLLGLGPNGARRRGGRIGSSTHLVPIRSPRFVVEFSRLLRDGRYDVVSSEPRLLSGIIVWIAARQTRSHQDRRNPQLPRRFRKTDGQLTLGSTGSIESPLRVGDATPHQRYARRM
jgi:hypothetical protein